MLEAQRGTGEAVRVPTLVRHIRLPTAPAAPAYRIHLMLYTNTAEQHMARTTVDCPSLPFTALQQHDERTNPSQESILLTTRDIDDGEREIRVS